MSDSDVTDDSEVHSDSYYEDMCQEFSNITKTDSAQAFCMLKDHKWNLQVYACKCFFIQWCSWLKVFLELIPIKLSKILGTMGLSTHQFDLFVRVVNFRIG